MPISRYEIRNEYSLADPELYRAADKDDPEALLEGVAMAGLVGVLRQLGDLAEFAAEIFHNLHEEVLATAARGHGLMDRVQQLETEIPSIERAFLSKTDNSSYFYHPAVDWHPNLRIDQNLITQGDLPRFVMNSYEECRAPPRLFLLDKFDVAGAGSCLKRYTDPSFFKVETSGMTNADVKREKKIRRAKKKGPRWRNGETTEVLPTSRTKLHQLLMEEERIENGVRNPTRRVELKRKLNGFPFNLKIGKSYMEKLLDYPSPDNKMVHEVTVNSSMSTTFDHNESGLEIVEVRPVCPDSENVGSKRSPPSSPDREEIMMNSSVYESSEVAIDDKNICNLYPSTATVGGISSTLDNVTREKVIEMNGESNREGSLIGYQSDDIVSEVDNYVDATSTIESDTDADSTSRMQSDFISSNIKLEPLISDANEENLQMGSFDSQSIGDSTISDEGNNSSRKAMSSLFSDSPSTSAENPQLERISTKVSKPVVFDDTCSNTDAITNHKSDYEQVTSNLCSSESIPALVNSDSGLVGKDVVEGPQSDETDFTLHDEEKKLNLVMDPPCSSCVYDSDLQSGDELIGESIPSISTVSHIHYHSTNSSDKVTSDLPHGNEFVENTAFRFNSDHTENENGTSNEMNSSKTLVPGKLDDENLSNDFPFDYPHIVENGDNFECTVSTEENLMNGLDNEDSGVPTDSPNQFPCFMETFLKKKLEETSSVNTHSIDAEDSQSNSSIENQISSENLVLSHLANSSVWPEAGIDAHDGDVIPDEETPKPCEVLGLAGTGLTRQASPDDSEAPCSSSFIPGELKEVTEMDETSNGQEVTEVSVSVDLNLPDKVHILLNEPDSGEDNSYTADMASAVPELSDNLIIDDIPSPIGLSKSVEENIDLFEDSGIDELENGKNSLSGSHEESRLAEKVDQIKAATSFSETVNTIDSDNPESEVSGAAPYTHLDSEDDQVLQLVHPEIIHPPVEKSLLYREHDSEESIVQEEIGSLTSQLDHEVLHSCEITSEVSPINHQETIGPDDLKGDNYSELPRLSTNDIYVPKDPFDSILPPSNPSLETTQIDPGDVPPLPPLPPVQWMMTKLQHASSFTERETVKHEELFPQLISLPGGPTVDARLSSPSSFEEMKQSTSQTDDEPALKEKKVESSRMEVNVVHETVDLPPKNDNKLKQIVVPISESEFTSSTEEDGNANGSQIGKSPRPRHPLIDEFVALDKSKLRKVAERVIPEVPKVEERESLLEQIRTKSFNLRPALTSRPSIRGPNTNLKVAAIVERANAIRQALAGSDEDDDDSWSDS